MATGGLYGSSPNGNVIASAGSESSGLYGNIASFGGTYFEYLIFIESATVPTTPTGGSWSFTSNSGTPPTGWSNTPPQSPTNPVYMSIALVNSRSSTALIWSLPGQIFKQGPQGPTGPTGPQGPQGIQGNPGTAAIIAAGTTTTGAAGTSASVTNSGTSSAAVFNFTIPRGDTVATGPTGAAATIAVGTTTTGSPGSSATVTNSGTSGAAVFNFTIPQGATGTAATVSVGTTITGAAGTSASVTNSGTSSAAVFNFTIPKGDTGATGPQGPTGATGAGVATGGTTGQVLTKLSSTNYDTGWTTPVVYPGAGIPNSTGSAWGTSYSTSGSGNVALTTGASLTSPIQVSYEAWTPTTAPSYAEGRLWYDSTAHALTYFNDVNTAVVHIGQDLQIKVINNTGSTIPNGSPVYITGTSSGQTYPNVALAKADVAATASVIGLTNGAIANGAVGYVTAQGGIDGVNTGTFTVGQVLYLSPYSAGQLMNTIPPTGITVQVGVVSYVDSSAGKIYVKQTTPLAVPASIITGAVAIANGGTGQTTANAAFNALAPAQTGNSGKYLTTNGTNTSWASVTTGTVTSVSGTGTVSGITLTGTVTSSGNLTLGGTLDLSSPPAIGGTTPAPITGTTITGTSFVGIYGGSF
jgi:hypothetical protein